MCPPLFLLGLRSNYNQTWHDGTLEQNLSKAIKSLLMSSLGCKYDVIKPFLVLFQVKIRVPLSFELKFGTGVNSEALISNLRQKMRFFTKNLKILPKRSWTKEFQMMPYIIILKVRKFHQSSRNRFGTAEKKPVGGGGGGHRKCTIKNVSIFSHFNFELGAQRHVFSVNILYLT